MDSHHPYGRYSSIHDYDNLQRDDLIRFYDNYYINGKCALFIAGNLPADIEQLLNKYFGSLSLNKKEMTSNKLCCAILQKQKNKI